MLSEKANKIYKLKYAKKGEEWEDTCLRVANHIASAEDNEENETLFTKEFFNMIYEKAFLPGGRILANAGTGIRNLNNCFVLPIEDSRQSIYSTLKDAAEIFAWGGGVGFNFSNIREENADVITTGGKASGPLSFMSLFDQTGEVISQASRRGAQIGLLNIDHPDIEKFIEFKSTPNNRNKRLLEEYKRNLLLNELNDDGKEYFKVLEKTLQDDQLSHFNISVGITDKFMEAVKNDENWDLISRLDKSVVKTVRARELMDKLANMAWESGDPGVFFIDRTNVDNMVPYLGDIEATNPCGEIGLLAYEPCCLGSLNLHRFYDKETKSVDFEFMEYVVRLAVRFLDDVQDKSETPVHEVNYWSKGLRRLGLGVMGWADLLAELEIPYGSPTALNLGNYISWFMSFFGWLESYELAKEKGSFDFYEKDLVDLHVVEKTFNSGYLKNARFDLEEFRNTGFRNVAVTAIAPTGTIPLLCDVNSSIEPYFALAYRRNITEGVGNLAKDFVIEINPILFRKLKEKGFTQEQIDSIKETVISTGSIQSCDEIPEQLREVFKTSLEIDPMDHIKMQAAWQGYVDNSISKTINLPEEATPVDVVLAYINMWAFGLKGGTIYRNNSKSFQVLNVGTK